MTLATHTRPVRRIAAMALSASLLGLAACAVPPTAALPGAPTEVVLPLRHAWFEGQRVAYVSTDASDPDLARELGVNYVPRLAAALPPEGAPPGSRHALERVYAFVGGEQDNVFPSVPQPVGPASADRAYSPLWRMVALRWQSGARVRLLTSEEAVLDAVEKGELSMTITRVVINCAVVATPSGGRLPGSR